MFAKRFSLVFLALALLLSAAACSGAATAEPSPDDSAPPESAAEQPPVSLANPWVDTTEEAIKARFGITFGVPEQAENMIFRLAESLGMAEMKYTLDGVNWTARIAEATEFTDISGMAYLWTKQEKTKLGKIEGSVRTCTVEGRNYGAGLWFNQTMNLMYSLSGASDTELDFSSAASVFPS